MPNTSTITALADFISSHEELPFEMRKATRPTVCGTAGCIGGFAAALWPYEVACKGHPRFLSFSTEAVAQRLGLQEDEYEVSQSDVLFFPGDNDVLWADTWEQVDYDEITRAGAISTLRRLAATGEVVWVKEEQL